MDINETLRDAQFKDARPEATVEKILSILADNGIQTKEYWHETSVPYCFALTIKIPGTTFSVNGKGLTRGFARASGYGELMERLQLGYTGAPGMQKDGSYSFDKTKYAPYDVDTLLSEGMTHYTKLTERLEEFLSISLSPKQLLEQFRDTDGTVPCADCYDITNRKPASFPNEIRMRVYGSNGCAAGNSIEEAIVQAISEIVERHNQSQIILERITPPDIPEDVLQANETAYKIITYVRAKGYRVLIKDCSLGKGFPVVCACFIHEKSGKYHTHFGAYPIFEIALERALTESFQGRNIETIAQFDDLIYRPSELGSLASVTNEFAKGTYKKSVDFFIGEPAFPFQYDMGSKASGNRELLKECVEHFRRMGYDILVYNSATLGFPTCHVLIPGYSEIFIHRLCAKTDDRRYFHHSVRTLRCPSSATIPDMLGMLMHLDQMSRYTPETKRAHGFLNGARLSADLTEREASRLMSASLGYVYYALGRYPEAVRCIDAILPGMDGEDASYLIALKRYLSMRMQKMEPDRIWQVLACFHEAPVLRSLKDTLHAGDDPFEPFTLHCDLNCREDCPIYGKCCNRRVSQLDKLISTNLKRLSFDAFSRELEQLLG